MSFHEKMKAHCHFCLSEMLKVIWSIFCPLFPDASWLWYFSFFTIFFSLIDFFVHCTVQRYIRSTFCMYLSELVMIYYSFIFQVSAPLSLDWTHWIIQPCIICLMKILFEIWATIVKCPSSYLQHFTNKSFFGHVHRWRWVFCFKFYPSGCIKSNYIYMTTIES